MTDPENRPEPREGVWIIVIAIIAAVMTAITLPRLIAGL